MKVAANCVPQDTEKAFFHINRTARSRMFRLPATVDTLYYSPFLALNICNNSNKGLLGEIKNVVEIFMIMYACVDFTFEVGIDKQMLVLINNRAKNVCEKDFQLNYCSRQHTHTHTCSL